MFLSALGFFAVGQFSVEKKTEPSLTNLTKTNIVFDGEVSHSEKSAHGSFKFSEYIRCKTLILISS